MKTLRSILPVLLAFATPMFASVTVTSPANNSTVTSPVHYVATAATSTCSKGVASMGIYVDNSLKYVVDSTSMNTTLSLSAGSYQTVVQEWDHCGGSTYTKLNITVSGSSGGGGSSTVVVTSPVNNSTVSSPVQYVATATTTCSKGVASMGIYVDNSRKYVVDSASMNTTLSLSSGTYQSVVQEWDHCGGSTYTKLSFTVASGPAPTVSMNASPASITLGASSTLTVTATNSTSVSITGSDGTTYPLASTGGTITVSPTASTTYKATAKGTGTTASAASDLVTVTPPTLIDYTQYKGDIGGTGANMNEVLLAPAKLNSSHFGMAWSFTADGAVSAQPLYVHGLTINGVTHNVLFVATNNDSLYALDASSGKQIWKRSFLASGVTPVNLSKYGENTAGILSTPVIDTTAQTMYAVVWTAENNNTSFPRQLHAINITNGSDTLTPVVISDPVMPPLLQMQRPALLLLNGTIYVAFGSVSDTQPYHGLLFAFDEATLAQTAEWNDSPSGSEAGIWMHGAAPVADSLGNIYISSGNGTFDGSTNFGESAVKLSPALSVLDYFAPYNNNSLSSSDLDLGSGGVVVVPDQPGPYPHELIVCGKPKPIYVLNRDNMGQVGTSSDKVIQELDNAIGATGSFRGSGQPCYNSPAVWNNSVYFAANHDVLKMFAISPVTGQLSLSSSSSTTYLYPGADPVVSSNGTTNGIVWTVETGSATLHANDATDVSKSLYVSPSMGSVFRWVPATVVNGYVYVSANTKIVAFTNF